MAFYVAKWKLIGEYCLLCVKTTFIPHVSQTPLCLLSIWSYSWSYGGQKLLLISIRTWTRVCFSFWKAANMIPPWRGLWALYRFSKPHILSHKNHCLKHLNIPDASCRVPHEIRSVVSQLCFVFLESILLVKYVFLVKKKHF